MCGVQRTNAYVMGAEQKDENNGCVFEKERRNGRGRDT